MTSGLFRTVTIGVVGLSVAVALGQPVRTQPPGVQTSGQAPASASASEDERRRHPNCAHRRVSMDRRDFLQFAGAGLGAGGGATEAATGGTPVAVGAGGGGAAAGGGGKALC